MEMLSLTRRTPDLLAREGRDAALETPGDDGPVRAPLRAIAAETPRGHVLLVSPPVAPPPGAAIRIEGGPVYPVLRRVARSRRAALIRCDAPREEATDAPCET